MNFAAKPEPARWYIIGRADAREGRPCEPPRTKGRICARTYREGHEDGLEEGRA